MMIGMEYLMHNGIETKYVLAIALLLVLLSPLDFACMTNANCPGGEICAGCPTGQNCGGGGVCKQCSTSAECLVKTFEEAIPGQGLVSPWFTIAMAAAMISFLGAGLVYVIGQSFGIEPIKRAGNAEVWQAIASMILIAMLFGAEAFEYSLVEQLETMSSVAGAAIVKPELFQGGQATASIKVNPFEVSYAFLRTVSDCLSSSAKKINQAANPLEFLVNMRLGIIVKIPYIAPTGTPLEPFQFIRNTILKVAKYEYDADEIVWLSIFTYFQMAFLKFIETSMFTLFLPVGIILRAFPPTRGAGAVMMALAIGFYMVYPLTYTLLYVGTPPTLGDCSLTVNETASFKTNTCPLAAGSAASTIGSAQTTASSLEVVMPELESRTTSIKYVSYVYLLISLGVTFIFIRSASGILGADISEVGRSMFRMM
jgi:hypothetical protein